MSIDPSTLSADTRRLLAQALRDPVVGHAVRRLRAPTCLQCLAYARGADRRLQRVSLATCGLLVILALLVMFIVIAGVTGHPVVIVCGAVDAAEGQR